MIFSSDPTFPLDNSSESTKSKDQDSLISNESIAVTSDLYEPQTSENFPQPCDISKSEIEKHYHQVNDKKTGLLDYDYNNRPNLQTIGHPPHKRKHS